VKRLLKLLYLLLFQPEAWKEMGKFFLNLALLFMGALVIQPLVKQHGVSSYTYIGVIGFATSLFIGFVLISAGEILKNKGERDDSG